MLNLLQNIGQGNRIWHYLALSNRQRWFVNSTVRPKLLATDFCEALALPQNLLSSLFWYRFKAYDVNLIFGKRVCDIPNHDLENMCLRKNRKGTTSTDITILVEFSKFGSVPFFSIFWSRMPTQWHMSAPPGSFSMCKFSRGQLFAKLCQEEKKKGGHHFGFFPWAPRTLVTPLGGPRTAPCLWRWAPVALAC